MTPKASPNDMLPQEQPTNPIMDFINGVMGKNQQLLSPVPPESLIKPDIKSPIPQNQMISSSVNSLQSPAKQNHSAFSAYYENTIPYAKQIQSIAAQNNIEPEILAGTLAHESMQFNPKYVKGYHTDGTGRGIAAIDKKWHPEVSDEQAFDPNFAITWAGKKLAALRAAAGGDINTALRMYNGGNNYDSQTPGYAGVPVAQRTTDYANIVNKLADTFKTGQYQYKY